MLEIEQSFSRLYFVSHFMKTLAIHLRVRDCKPIIIYIISLSFHLLLLQLQILERFLAQTLTSHYYLSVERSFGACVGSIRRSHRLADAIWS